MNRKLWIQGLVYWISKDGSWDQFVQRENWAEAAMVLQYDPALLVSLFPGNQRPEWFLVVLKWLRAFISTLTNHWMWVTNGADVPVDKGFLLLNLLLNLCRWGSPRAWITKCPLKEGIDYKSQCPPHRRHQYFRRRPGFPCSPLFVISCFPLAV